MLGRGTDALLIVNADDWGGWDGATDRIAATFAAGAITSTTAMVHMADSARAAALADEIGIPLGLHLNLTQPFDGTEVPETVRERQRRLCARFSPRTLLRRTTADPRPDLQRLVRDAILDQLDTFRATYGREPTHVDSHHHVHSCPDVFRQLPHGLRVRRTLARHSFVLARRFSTTARFYAISQLVPELGGRGLDDAIAFARHKSVEIMVHPSFDEDLPVLLSDGWREAIAQAPLGDYRDVRLRPPPATVPAALTGGSMPALAEMLGTVPV